MFLVRYTFDTSPDFFPDKRTTYCKGNLVVCLVSEVLIILIPCVSNSVNVDHFTANLEFRRMLSFVAYGSTRDLEGDTLVVIG